MADDDKVHGANTGGEDEPRVFKVASPGGRRAFLRTLSKGAAAGTAAVVADNCSGPSSPSENRTTSSTSSTSTTTSTTTTSVLPTFTLAGVISDRSGRPVGGARVFVVDGPNANRSSMTDGNGYYSISGLVQSSFTLRTTMNGVFLFDIAVTITRDTRLDFGVTTTTSTTTTTTAATTSVPSCPSNTICTCNQVCSCNPLTYFYPN